MQRYLRRVVFSPHIAGAGIIIGCAAVLQAMIGAGLVPELIVARPTDAVGAIVPLVREADLIGNFFVTFGMTAAATAIALAIGIPVGYLLYRHKILGEAYEGWLGAIFASPLVLLYPLFLVIFGRTHLTLIIMGCIPGSIPIIIQTRQGLVSVSRTLMNVGRSFNLTPQQMFWKIQFPAAVPAIFNGIKLGVMYTLVTVVAIEYLTMRFEIPQTYASILSVIFVSVLLYGAFGRLEKWLRPV
jgi:ABC-type nitrate/sulfonate/bicarbonate transport system permease component